MISDAIVSREISKLEKAGNTVNVRKDVIVLNEFNFYIDLINDVVVVDSIVIDNQNMLKDLSKLKMILMSSSSVVNEYVQGDNFQGFVLRGRLKGKVYDSVYPSVALETSLIFPLKLQVIRITPIKN